MCDQFEGVAYRGRVLLEVNSDLDHALHAAKGEKIHPFKRELSQEKFILFGFLTSATMIKPHDQPVQFEVSIGLPNGNLRANSRCF